VDVPAARGTTFTPLPPESAIGNFTKIVQRLPVKIIVAPDQPLARLLRVGMSVETTIHTRLADVVAAIVTQGSGCDLLKVWRDHADEVRGHGIDSGHWWPQAIGKRLNRLTSTCAGRGRCWKFFQ
jgi:hypothetical protein